MAKKAFNTTEQAINLYDELYDEQVQERGAEYTHGSFFQDLVENYQRNKNAAAVADDLREKLNYSDSQRTLAEQQLAELRASVESKESSTAPIIDLLEKYGFNSVEHLEQLLNAKPEVVKVEVPAEIKENQILLTIPEPTLPILSEVCRRLSEKFGREISPADVLLDGFVKYNVEQYQEWFYPFTIAESEFVKICGYSHEQLLNWLRNSK